MSEYIGHMGYVCKEINKLVGLENFLTWQKMIDLTLTKH